MNLKLIYRVVIFICFVISPLSGVYASTTIEETKWCRYTDAKGRIVFDGKCSVNRAILNADGCRNSSYRAGRYIVTFTSKSKIAVYIQCDGTVTVNDKKGILLAGMHNGKETIRIVTEESENFEFEAVYEGDDSTEHEYKNRTDKPENPSAIVDTRKYNKLNDLSKNIGTSLELSLTFNPKTESNIISGYDLVSDLIEKKIFSKNKPYMMRIDYSDIYFPLQDTSFLKSRIVVFEHDNIDSVGWLGCCPNVGSSLVVLPDNYSDSPDIIDFANKNKCMVSRGKEIYLLGELLQSDAIDVEIKNKSPEFIEISCKERDREVLKKKGKSKSNSLDSSNASSYEIFIIKNGIMEFNKTLTVGEALDNWKSCEKNRWKSFVSDNGVKVVEFKCWHKNVLAHVQRIISLRPPSKPPTGVKYIVSINNIFKFTINKDDTFQIDNIITEIVWADGLISVQSDPKLYILKAAYSNEISLDPKNIPNTYLASLLELAYVVSRSKVEK